MAEIINPIIVLGGLGLLFGLLLSLASRVFAVETDPRVDEVLEALPGANCGACGFPGCEGLAKAQVSGEASPEACPIGGQETADRVAAILGLTAGDMDKEVAVVLCQGDCDKAKDKYRYEGIQDCRIADLLSDGHKECSFGCLGCGTCYDVCPFDAIEMINGIPVIDRDKCTACLKCIEICPKDIIELMPYDNRTVVKCISEDPGKKVRGYCEVGCIGCKICVKQCPEDAFTFENYLAKIDYEKCTNCMICVEKCPTNAIPDVKDEVNLKQKQREKLAG